MNQEYFITVEVFGVYGNGAVDCFKVYDKKVSLSHELKILSREYPDVITWIIGSDIILRKADQFK